MKETDYELIDSWPCVGGMRYVCRTPSGTLSLTTEISKDGGIEQKVVDDVKQVVNASDGSVYYITSKSPIRLLYLLQDGQFSSKADREAIERKKNEEEIMGMSYGDFFDSLKFPVNRWTQPSKLTHATNFN